jgi:hypothetical protein
VRVSERHAELIEAQDLNGLLRAVDSLCEERAWQQLLDLAERCREAVERGKQLWPITAHVQYRLALEAPAEFAGPVLSSDAERFSLGPLTEVAASTHTWAELAPYLSEPQVAAYVAQERVLRGERLAGDGRAHPEVLELPLELSDWEPTYTLARFKSSFVEVSEPWEPRADLKAAKPIPYERRDAPDVTEALLDLVSPWTAESNGAARAVVTEGDVVGAISALVYEDFRFGRMEVAEAIQQMGWAAASGGAHGRRRGAAFGRFLAWYTGALLTNIEWPADAIELGSALSALRWYRWDEGGEEEGWVFRLGVEHPDEGWAAVIGATDLSE